MPNFDHLAAASKKNPAPWLLAATFVAGFVYLLVWSHWNGVTFINVNAGNIVGYLTPLILTAALIERAVEVVITPWRDPDADTKITKLAAVKAKAEKDGATDNDQDAVTASAGDLNQYRGKTRQYAYAIALALSVLAVTAGVRTLWPLLQSPGTILEAQANFFRWYDMVLTALLLAGGAAGLHAPINAFTGFFEKSNN